MQCCAFGWRSKRFGCDDDAKATKRTIRQEFSSKTNGFTDKCALRDFHAVVGMVGLQLRKYTGDNWHEMEASLKVPNTFLFFSALRDTARINTISQRCSKFLRNTSISPFFCLCLVLLSTLT